MLNRTRVLGPEMIDAMERLDEVFEAHETDKRGAWQKQGWEIHAGRAIRHLLNAIQGQCDPVEQELSHGLCRALCSLQQYIATRGPLAERHLCAEHAKRCAGEPIELDRLSSDLRAKVEAELGIAKSLP